MAKTTAQRQRAFQARRKALMEDRLKLVLEVLDGITNGSNGITVTTTTDLWGITFHWRGEKAGYDAVEGRANALGFTLSTFIAELENRAVERYQVALDAEHKHAATQEYAQAEVQRLRDDLAKAEQLLQAGEELRNDK